MVGVEVRAVVAVRVTAGIGVRTIVTGVDVVPVQAVIISQTLRRIIG